MPMVGGGNGDRVYILVFKKPPKILLRYRDFAHLLLASVPEFREDSAVHIAHIRDTRRIPIGLERREMGVAPAIQADHRENEADVGSNDLAIAFCRSRHCQRGRSNGKTFQKFASRSHHFSSSFRILAGRDHCSQSTGYSSPRQRLSKAVHAPSCRRLRSAGSTPMSFEAQTVTEIVALKILKLANPIDHAASHWRPIIFMARLTH